MEYNFIYSAICVISAALAFSLALLSIIHYKSASLSQPFRILAVCAGVYAFGYAFEILKGEPDWIFFWLRIEYIGLSFMPAVWLWFSLTFTGQEKKTKPLFLATIFGFSLLILISVLTNGYHHLYYSYIKVDNSGLFPAADLGKNILYNVHSAWMFFSFSISWLVYLFHYLKAPPIYKNRTMLMIIANTGVIADYLIYVLGMMPWDLDIGPVIIAVDGCLMAFGVLKMGILDISPIARDRIFESMRDGVIVADVNGNIMDFNPSAQKILPGLSRDWLGRDLAKLQPEFRPHAGAGGSHPGKLLVLSRGHETGVYRITEIPIMVKPAKRIGTAWSMQEITEEYMLLSRLKDHAERDFLTRVWNRRKWLEMAERVMAEARWFQEPMAMMLIDLDDFKAINDTLGHQAGDRVLARTSATIAAGLRPGDIFGRIGGEEFAIILPQIGREEASALADRLVESVAGMSFGGERIVVTISLGIAICRDSLGISLERFMREADKALYKAKGEGRNRACVVEIDF